MRRSRGRCPPRTPRALLALDVALARDLLVAGRAAWQALAGAALDAPPAGGWHARLTYDDAPFGVGYFVAAWFPPETAPR